MVERPRMDEFVFVLLAGLILIVVFMIGFPSLEEEAATSNKSVNATITSSGDVSRFVSLGDFVVSYSLGTEVLDSKSNFDVYKGYFNELGANLIGDISDDKLSILKDATLVIKIDNTNSLGNLIVSVNDNQVYKQAVSVGSLSIPVDISLLNGSNVVSIQTDYSDFRFWDKSNYHIDSAKLEIQYQGSSFKDFDFYLDDKEFNNYKFGELTLTFNPEEASETNNLLIEINDDRFYYSTPPLLTFKQEVPKAFLRLGDNTISFSVDPTATYNLEDVTLALIRTQ